MCPESKDTKTVIVNSPPVVEMTSVEKTCVGKLIEFEAGAHDPDNDALEYYWSFGDGTILRSGSKVSHAYKEGGKFRVTVIVDDSQGTACSTATATTTVVVNAPPIADAGTNLTCCVEKSTQFDASNSTDSDGDPLTYSWDFGDGTKASGKVVNHAYKTGGSYNVRLVVDDNSGTACNSDSAGFVADVNAGPVPVMDIR
ncbi:MAG: PKD domain-containing protein, partial [Candidatus Omnitrophica bacterium]|nr:PKD domain-containing protein [Candidatus Omnitrophota bacterium]